MGEKYISNTAQESDVTSDSKAHHLETTDVQKILPEKIALYALLYGFTNICYWKSYIKSTILVYVDVCFNPVSLFLCHSGFLIFKTLSL